MTHRFFLVSDQIFARFSVCATKHKIRNRPNKQRAWGLKLLAATNSCSRASHTSFHDHSRINSCRVILKYLYRRNAAIRRKCGKNCVTHRSFLLCRVEWKFYPLLCYHAPCSHSLLFSSQATEQTNNGADRKIDTFTTCVEYRRCYLWPVWKLFLAFLLFTLHIFA